MRKLFLLVFCAIAVSAQSQTKDYDADVKTVDSIIAALYDVISGEKGAPRDWDRFKNLFTADAKLIPTFINREGKVAYRAITPAEYEASFTKNASQKGFFEKEVVHRKEEFGNIVHVFSTYETSEERNGKITMRGVNSIQLLKTEDRYYVMNIFWSAETEKNPLPAKYLRQD